MSEKRTNEVADARKPSCRHQSEGWMGDCDLCQKDCHVEIERLIASLAEANANANRLTAERDWLRAAVEKMGRAGDCLAHQLTFKDNGGLLSIWWEARGGHEACTACNETESK